MTESRPGGALWPLLERLSMRPRLLLALVAGALAATGQAPWSLWPLTILGLAAVFALARPLVRPAQVALIWWIAGCGYFGLSLSWIVEPFFVDIRRHGWMAPFALILMAGGMALFWGVAGGLARRLVRGRGLAYTCATVLALTLTGVIRGVIFTGFPWALPGHVLIATPVLHLAQIGGAILLSLLILTSALTLPWALTRPHLRLPVWIVLAGLVWTAGLLLTPPPPDTQGRPVVRLIQPNIPQHEKWDPLRARDHFERLLALSSEPGTPDLVVWPETAVPAWLEDVPHLMPVLSDAAGPRPLVFGINRGDGARIYNSLVLLDPEGEIAEVYDKHHLVPFGEYTPLGDSLGRFGIRGLAQRDGNGFSAGPGARLIDIPGIGATLPLICYEGIFPRDLAAAPDRPDLLLLITNDAWFGTVSGPYQHLAQARLRAVEQGLPMIRVANTGISAVIDPAGRLTGTMSLGSQGVRDVALPAPDAPTLYARVGDTPIALLLGAALALLALRNRQKPTHKDIDAPANEV